MNLYEDECSQPHKHMQPIPTISYSHGLGYLKFSPVRPQELVDLLDDVLVLLLFLVVVLALRPLHRYSRRRGEHPLPPQLLEKILVNKVRT